MLEDPGGLVLHVTEVTAAGEVQARDASSEPSTTGRFRIDPFFMRAHAINLGGPLTTRADATGLTIGLRGTGLGGGGRCGQTEVTRSCRWLLAP